MVQERRTGVDLNQKKLVVVLFCFVFFHSRVYFFYHPSFPAQHLAQFMSGSMIDRVSLGKVPFLCGFPPLPIRKTRYN